MRSRTKTHDDFASLMEFVKDETPTPNRVQWTYQGVTHTGTVEADWYDAEARYMRISWDKGGSVTIGSRTLYPRFEELVYIPPEQGSLL